MDFYHPNIKVDFFASCRLCKVNYMFLVSQKYLLYSIECTLLGSFKQAQCIIQYGCTVY